MHMHVVVNTLSLPVFKKYRIDSLLCIFETSVYTMTIRLEADDNKYFFPFWVFYMRSMSSSVTFPLDSFKNIIKVSNSSDTNHDRCSGSQIFSTSKERVTGKRHGSKVD